MRYHQITTEASTVGCSCHVDLLAEGEDSGVVAPDDYRLKEKYEHFNHTLFGGELPDIPTRFARMKAVGGHVTAKTKPSPEIARLSPATLRKLGLSVHRNATLVPGSVSMAISSTYLRSEQGLDAILLHEMIHVWLFTVVHDFVDNHGPRFLSKAREIGAAVGYTIPLTDSSSALEVVPTATDRAMGVVLLEKKDGSYSYAMLTLNAFRGATDIMAKRWQTMVPGYVNRVKLYEISSPIWTAQAVRHPVQRVTDHKLKFFMLKSEEALDDLREHGTLVRRVDPPDEDQSERG